MMCNSKKSNVKAKEDSMPARFNASKKYASFAANPSIPSLATSINSPTSYPRGLAEWPLVVTQHPSMPPRSCRTPFSKLLESPEMAKTFEILDFNGV